MEGQIKLESAHEALLLHVAKQMNGLLPKHTKCGQPIEKIEEITLFAVARVGGLKVPLQVPL